MKILRQKFRFHGASFTTEKWFLYFISYILIYIYLKHISLRFYNKDEHIF